MNSARTQISRWLKRSDDLTLLGVCPNTKLVATAAILASAELRAPIMFAATLNQVDTDGGYTGWTPKQFARFVQSECDRHNIEPLPLCLDHGGPKIKDSHDALDFGQSLDAVKQSIRACVDVGYQLIHIDCTVPEYQGESLDRIVERTVDLIAFTEACRFEAGASPLDYEIGTDEVEGGITQFNEFDYFLRSVVERLSQKDLPLPVFVVAQVGTSLETTTLDETAAIAFKAMASDHGIGLKCHYGDYTRPREIFRRVGAAGVNVGPEFSAVQYRAFDSLESTGSEALIGDVQLAVIESGRWRKWLLRGEEDSFDSLTKARKEFLFENCSRYVWATPGVDAQIRSLFAGDASLEDFVVNEIKTSIQGYLQACGLVDFFR